MLLCKVKCLLANGYLCSEKNFILFNSNLSGCKYDVEFLTKNDVLFFVSCGILFNDEDE